MNSELGRVEVSRFWPRSRKSNESSLFGISRSVVRGMCLLLWIGMLGGGTACKKREASQMNSVAPAQSANSVIRIGEVSSLTGSDASFGVSTHQGIVLALEEINSTGGIQGKKVELVTLDDQGKASEAVLAMTRLIKQDQVAAVLGEVASSISLAMAPIAQQYQVPMISPSSINSKLTEKRDFVFRVCFVDSFQSKVMADFALNHLKAKRAALLVDVKSDYSQDSAKIFSDLFKKGGGQIVLSQSYSAGDVDFKSQLTAIRALRPDVILVPGYYTEIGLIARQRVELGISAPLLGGDGWDSPKLKEIGGSAVEGSFYVSHFWQDDPLPSTRKFIQNYQAKYRVGSPDGLAALAYDATLLLADALKRTGGQGSIALRDAIASTRDFAGVTGKITINSQRNADKAATVFQVVEGGNLKIAAKIQP